MAEEKNPDLGADPNEAEPEEPTPATEAPDVEGAPSSASARALTPGQRLAAKKAQKAIEKREFRDDLRRQQEESRQKEQEEADRLLGRVQPTAALPEAVDKVAGSFTSTLQDHRGAILGALAAGLAIAGAVLLFQRYSRSGDAELATQFGQALALVAAPVDAEDADGLTDDGKPLFKSEQERATKVLAALDGVAKAEEDVPAVRWAQLGAAAAALELGKWDDAQARFRKISTNAKEPMLRARALEGLALALEGAGKGAEATKVIEQLKSVPGSEQLAQYHLARMQLAAGDREGAKSQLKALYDALKTPPEGGAPSTYLRSEVEVRLAEIDSTLVDQGALGGGGAPQQFTQEQIQKLIEQMQRQQGNAGAGAE